MADDKSFYEKLVDVDIIFQLRKPLEKGLLWLDPEAVLNDTKGKLKYKREVNWNVPWRYVKSHEDTRCFMWFDLMFDYFGSTGFIRSPASGCMNCWKVVVRPRTLEELFKLEKLERECGFPCKCGIEVRPIVHGNYGGYFYTRSLEEGRKRYKEVRQLVDEQISKDVPVLLKRGCTELEMHFGDSANWKFDPKADWLEGVLWDLVREYPDSKIQQMEIIQNHVKRLWIDHAFRVGDPTYSIFTNGKNLSLDYRTYHENDDPLDRIAGQDY